MSIDSTLLKKFINKHADEIRSNNFKFVSDILYTEYTDSDQYHYACDLIKLLKEMNYDNKGKHLEDLSLQELCELIYSIYKDYSEGIIFRYVIDHNSVAVSFYKDPLLSDSEETFILNKQDLITGLYTEFNKDSFYLLTRFVIDKDLSFDYIYQKI